MNTNDLTISFLTAARFNVITVMRLIVCKVSHCTELVRDVASFKLELRANWLCPANMSNHEGAVGHALSLAAALAEMLLAVLFVKECPV